MDNQLAVIANQAGLAEEKTKTLLQNFGEHFEKARSVVKGSKDIVVTAESQTDLMKKARTARLALKDIRVEVEKTRREMKEQSLREGKAVDGIANVIKALIIPVEEHLEKQEKFAEIAEKKRLDQQYQDRVEKIVKYGGDPSIYQLRQMDNETFTNLVDRLEQEQLNRIEAEKKLEAERIEREMRLQVFSNRRMELAHYRDFVNDFVLSESTTEEEYQKALDLAKKSKAEYEKKQEEIRKQNEELRIQAEKDRKAKELAEEKLKAERLERERKEKEERARVENERRIAEEAEKKRVAEQQELERQKLLAPDKDKLMELANTIDKIQLPAVSSKEAGSVIRSTEQMIEKMSAYIREKAKAL